MSETHEIDEKFDGVNEWLARIHADEMISIIPDAIKENKEDDEIIADVINGLTRVISTLIVFGSKGMLQKVNTMNVVELLVKYNKQGNVLKQLINNDDCNSVVH